MSDLHGCLRKSTMETNKSAVQLFQSRARDSTPCSVRPSVRLSVRPSVRNICKVLTFLGILGYNKLLDKLTKINKLSNLYLVLGDHLTLCVCRGLTPMFSQFPTQACPTDGSTDRLTDESTDGLVKMNI